MYNSWAYSLAQVKTFSQSNNKKRNKKRKKISAFVIDFKA